MTLAHAALVMAAGFCAGAVNAVAGGGTLLTFPALLAAGVPPVLANTSSSVGLLAGYGSSSLAYRRELAHQTARTRALLGSSVLGGAVGAVLLLALPHSAFRAVVPYLVLLGAGLTAVQPRLARRLPPPRSSDAPGWETRALVGVLGIYGSYFGAGLGVVLLAVLGLLLADDVQHLNALKGLLSFAVNVVGVALFVASGQVRWSAAGLVAVGAVAGGTVGVSLARRLPVAGVRAFVVTVGLLAGVALLVRS